MYLTIQYYILHVKANKDPQEDTINVLSKLIYTGYTNLEERVTKIEEDLQNA